MNLLAVKGYWIGPCREAEIGTHVNDMLTEQQSVVVQYGKGIHSFFAVPAHMIDALPEMLEVLEEYWNRGGLWMARDEQDDFTCRHCFGSSANWRDIHHSKTCIVGKVAAAIAKARGETTP